MPAAASVPPRRILVTSALPYANGPLHLGHLLETIQTDIWVRFQRMRENECIYVCADDAHGTAIMLTAEQRGLTPEQQIAEVKADHERDFADFHISFDNYYTTHSEECRHYSELIYQRLRDNGHIAERTVTQLYDPERELFLADRYVKGTCPRCRADDQYGDNCEACGATYTPTELIEPRSALSGASPEERQSTHYFFRLPLFADMLREWIDGGSLQSAVANKLREWLDAGLQEWDISRDAPYFGFEIPDAPGKYFYVWLDAPIGYMASFDHWCQRSGHHFDEYWAVDSEVELHHFIGKDIINFHGLFWPAMLDSAGFRKPTAIHAHGFVTVNGQKMSKSRGTFIQARTYLDHLDAEYLRYYYASKLSAGVDDIDLNLDDFTRKVNADLVGKLVNIASRSARFVTSGDQGGTLAAELDDPELWQQLVAAESTIAELYEAREFGQAMRRIMALADHTNEYFDRRQPWVLAREESTAAEAAAVASQCLNHFGVLMTWLKPVLPRLAERAEALLGIPLEWRRRPEPLLNHPIRPFQPLLARIDAARVAAMVEASREDQASSPAAEPKQSEPKKEETALPLIDFDHFAQVDLRVVRIVQAEEVEGADRLLRLTLDLGDEQRQVLAGLKSAYSAEQLAGRLTVMVANLAPRTMRFGVSEGMVLAAGPGGDELFLLHPDEGARPGMPVR